MGSILRYDPRKWPSFTCRESIAELGSLLDESLSASRRRRLEKHLDSCDACRDYLRTYRETVRLAHAAFAAEDDESMPESLVRSVLSSRRAAI